MRILDTGINTANENMRLDTILLDELKEPTLHLYQWSRPSATFGYFIRPENHLNLEKASHFDLDLARRPTGGGIVFHIWDLAFSFLMPASHPHFSENTLDNYHFVNSVVLDVVKTYFSLNDAYLTPENGVVRGEDCKNFCMAKPTQYDVLFNGMKIAGSAQRKRKQGYLHQGTISLGFPNIALLENVLISKEDVLEAMKAYTFSPLKDSKLEKPRKEIENLLERKLDFALKF